MAQTFAAYLRGLGDTADFKMDAASYLRDGFGENPRFGSLVAENNGRVIGYLLFAHGYDSDSAARTLEILDLYVNEEHRKRGAGRALMSRAAQIAREAGAKDMIWAVYHANALATSFYERLGAHRVSDILLMKLRADSI